MICTYFEYGQFLKQFHDGIRTVLTNPVTLPTGSLGNPNITGMFIALCIPAAWRKERYIFIPLLIGSLLLMKARGGLLVSFIGLIYINLIGYFPQYSKWTKSVAPFAFTGSILGTFFLPRLYDSGRFLIWEKAIDKITLKSMFFGHGTGHVFNNPTLWSPYHRKYYVAELHNEYLEVFVNYGAIGLAIMFYLLSFPKKNVNLSAIVVVGLISMGYHFTMHQLTTGAIFVSALFYNEVEA
jgi:hypothetical protein